MKKNRIIVMIDPNTLSEHELRKKFPAGGPDSFVLIRKESELDTFFEKPDARIDVLIIEPRLSEDFLTPPYEKVEQREAGMMKIGLTILNKIKAKLGEKFDDVKLLFNTHSTEAYLESHGFTKNDLVNFVIDKPGDSKRLLEAIG